MEYYACPSCKTHNEEYIKYCKKCGTWLLSETYPATKVTRFKQKGKSKGGGWVFALLLFAALGVVGYIYSGGSIPTLNNARSIEFGDIDFERYTLSQFVVSKPLTGSIEASGDLTANVPSPDPIDITAVFYDESGKRLGKATATLLRELPEGHTTTVDFVFDRDVALSSIANARFEIVPISPFELLTRFSDRASNTQ